MKVILIDPLIRGHHIVHATYVAKWLLECADEVTFVAWKPNQALSPLEGLPLRMLYAGSGVDDEIGVDGHTIQGQFRMARTMRVAFDEARRQNADAVCLLFLDWFVVGALIGLFVPPIRPVRSRFSAALYWVYFERPVGERRPALMKLKYWLERQSLRLLISRWGVQTLFVFSDATRRKLNAYGISDGSMSVIPDPVEVPQIIPNAPPARERLNLPGEVIFLFFGETRLDKGPDILLSALSAVRGRCTVVFVGPENGVSASAFATAAANLPSNVRLVWRIERIPDADVPLYFAAADCVVLPYRKLYLGTSGAMQHAAAYGRPVIVSRVGVLGEIAEQNDLGIVVEPESPAALAVAMDEYLSAPEEWRNAKKHSSRAYGEQNDWRRYAQGIRASLMLSRNPKPRR
jgi:glycosyltransferase involved in cell wall biosynthesis